MATITLTPLTTYEKIGDATNEELRRLFPDDGCEASPACLRCPLLMCKHDDPVWYQRYIKGQSDRALLQVYRAARGPTKSERCERVARRLGLTTRTVWRRLGVMGA